jgi:hypothetical protein
MLPLLLLLFATQIVDLTRPDGLSLTNAVAETVNFKGRQGVRITQKAVPTGNTDAEFSLATVPGVTLQDGEIELELSGEPGPGASGTARGFVGLAFRVADAKNMEVIYLRPTNGRADDQIRRNHSVQYESFPDWPWFKLREQFPKKYETYVDLQPATWTRVRVTFEGQKARLYVHDAEQPTLVVNDLKRPAAAGGVALWIGPGTVAHFRGLKVTSK